MHKLYFVSAYNWERNERARFLVTASDPETARLAVEGEDTGKPERCEFVCETPDSVYMEV